jgi:gluconokinase
MAASPQASDAAVRPGRLRVVVMGVSGCGKSTVAEGIAAALGLACIDGDDLHTPENVAKMRGGTPLTDEDRWPWLDRIGARLCEPDRASNGVVVACSALRRAYRDRLRQAAPGTRFVYLHGTPDLIRARMQARRNHYMPPGLLDSQLRTLEPPTADEPGILAVDIDGEAGDVVASALAALRGVKADTRG